MRWRRRLLTLAALLLAAALAAPLAREALLRVVEREAFVAPPPGRLVPDALGAASQQLSFASGERMLRASWVPAADARAPAVAVFHGDEEELSRWAAVQARLHAAGIASFVFDYSGYGASTGRPGVANFRQDALAAYAQFVALTPQAERRVALGFSIGAAVLLDAAPALQPPPAGLVLGAAFASAREMAVIAELVPAWAAWALPDLWNNERRISEIALPVLLLHGRADELVPFSHAQRLCEASRGPRRLVPLEGMTHDAPLEPQASAAFWAAVVDATRGEALGIAGQAGARCR